MILRNIWLSAKFLQTWLDFFFFYHSVGVNKPCLPALGHVWMLARRTWPLLNAPISPEWKKKSMKRPREYINAARRRRQTGWKADRCYVKLQAPFSLCGCGFRCSFTSLWPHLSQHPSVILSFFPAHSSTAFSLSPPSRSACTPCVCVCVRGMIFWCPRCVWVLCLSTFSGWPLCLQPSYCSPTHSIRKWACAGA